MWSNSFLKKNIPDYGILYKYAAIFALLILLPYLIYIIYRFAFAPKSKEGFWGDLTREDIIELTDREKSIYMIFTNMNHKRPEIEKDSDVSLTKLKNGTLTPEEYINDLYNILKKHNNIYNEIVNELYSDGFGKKMEFDDFFVGLNMMIAKILEGKGEIDKVGAEAYKKIVEDWAKKNKKVYTAETSKAPAPATTAPATTAPATTAPATKANGNPSTAKVASLEDLLKALGAKAAPLPDTSKSEPAPTKGSKELEKLAKDASADVKGPVAPASEVAAIRVSSPGLSQGRGYLADCPMVKPAKPAPAYPRIQAPTCNCQADTPIMNDGRPFDPNEYIRKDSIPCWNCSIPR